MMKLECSVRSWLALVVLMFCSLNSIEAQEHIRCGTMQNLEQLEESDPELKERRKEIEKKIQDYINNPLRETDGDTVIIPIVFHIIHNGDPVGSGENIDDIYIEAQLEQLNDDFRRMNSDADGTWSQAADTYIEFCLAAIDPDGDPTTGIIRHNISGGPWTMNSFNANVKPVTIWDRDNYCNFWSADLSGGLLGYAQFPGGPANTDGIVNLYSSVGSIDLPNPAGGVYNIGRTATHEMGHWLDLRHIWGDDGNSCGGTDFCADTPNQGGNTFGCPSGVVTDNCATTSPGKMYQNYMDYTNDACMNLFTVDQRIRMQAALDVERVSLKTAVCGGEDLPVASFTPDSGTEIFCGSAGALSFTDASTGVIDTWSWTFSGAGVSPTTSSIANPTVTISASGTLTAVLTVSNSGGSDSHTGNITIDLKPITDPFCSATPCLDFAAGPYTSFNYADGCAITGCPVSSISTEVHENEAYTLAGLIGGLDYTFEFCTGYSETTWPSIITVGEYDPTTDAAVPNSDFAADFGCELSFTAPFDGDFIVVVSGETSCGAAENPVDNGLPTFACVSDCATQCGMLFTDNGGQGFNYGANEDKTYVICPDDPTCEVVEVDFSTFILATGIGDELKAYDGDDITAPLLGVFRGITSPNTLVSTHASGCLTFTFTSNATNSAPGWQADVTCLDNGTCTGNCPDDYAGANALTGTENGSGGMNGDGDYETDGAIESTQLISGGTVDYDSGVSVDLDNGFEISLGAEVDVFIDGCNDGGGGNTLTGDDEEQRRIRVTKTSRANRVKKP